MLKISLFILLIAGTCMYGCAAAEKKTTAVVEKSNMVDSAMKGIVSLKGSEVMKDILCQEWNNKEDVLNAKDLDITSDFEVPYRGYCFFNDGTVVKDPRGDVRIGTWAMQDQQRPIIISMAFSNGENETCQLAYLSPFEMILASEHENIKVMVDYNADARSNINLQEDPFYKSNMMWRVKPLKKENDEALRQRLKDCIHFFILFYEQKINARAETVSFLGLPSCFNWYAGGISLQKEAELQQRWIHCFYNEEQALKAYEFAGKLLRERYDLPKKESSWLKANLAILKKMEERVDHLAMDK